MIVLLGIALGFPIGICLGAYAVFIWAVCKTTGIIR